jgi:hypothetical protein
MTTWTNRASGAVAAAVIGVAGAVAGCGAAASTAPATSGPTITARTIIRHLHLHQGTLHGVRGVWVFRSGRLRCNVDVILPNRDAVELYRLGPGPRHVYTRPAGDAGVKAVDTVAHQAACGRAITRRLRTLRGVTSASTRPAF